MNRREFLRKAVAGVLAVATSTVFGKAASAATQAATIQVQVRVPGSSRTANIPSGGTALDALKSVYNYSSSGGRTTINGRTGSWIYLVNGMLVTGPGSYAGNYQLYSNKTIEFRPM